MARQKQRAMGSRNRGAGTESGGRVVRDRAVVKQDERLRVQMQEQAINEAIVREREDEIREIHQNVTKVNEVGHLQYANPTGRQMRNPPGHARRVRASLLVDPTHLPQIFKDLAEIVNDQQEDINTVEAMIEKSHAHARSGLDQVEKANEHQQGCVVS
mmetsp:Transcript_36586/g.97845  ORF Transcript_36586/g.97845 Transcript_36586/m.97845 type:complete len:158 (+) Transcript_36586:601-1074(+)